MIDFFLAFTLYYVDTFQILGWGRTENPGECPARPSLNVQDEITSFIPLLPTSYPLWGKMGCYLKKWADFFSTYIYYLLESILNQKRFWKKIFRLE